jgi:hypothetical protein
MVRNLLLAWSLAGLTASPGLAQEWAQKMFAATSHDLGSVARGAKAEYAFVLKNIYVEDVHIASVRASCGCATPRIEKALLRTYEQGAVVAKVNTDRFLGQERSTITVTFDKPFYARVRLLLKVYIRSDVEFDPPAVDFGTVDRGAPAEKTMTVTSTQREGWKILEVKSPNPHLSGEAVETSRQRNRVTYELRARLDENAPPGPFRDHLILVTNEPRAQEILIMAEGEVASDLSVSPSPLFLGVLHPGDRVTKQLVVRGKKPFRIRAMEGDPECFELHTPADDAPKPLHVVPITFKAGEQTGRVVKTIRIKTDLDGATVEVSAYAVVEAP